MSVKNDVKNLILERREQKATIKREEKLAYQAEYRKKYHTVAVAVPHALYDKLDAECAKLNVSNSYYIVTLLENALKS